MDGPPDARAEHDAVPGPSAGVAVGVDIGRVRIGVAVSDPATRMALPHSVVERKGTRRDGARLIEIFERVNAAIVIVGLPPGEDAAATTVRLARGFAAWLATNQGRPVLLVDEADTTVEATARLRALGMRAARRKRIIDQEAAAQILARWLDGAPAERVVAGEA